MHARLSGVGALPGIRTPCRQRMTRGRTPSRRPLQGKGGMGIRASESKVMDVTCTCMSVFGLNVIVH